jgi:hypothetical protein
VGLAVAETITRHNKHIRDGVPLAGDTFDVSGCGYDTSLGKVVIGFTGGGSGAVLGSDGCFTVSSITALAGDTLAPGTYPVTAYQYVRGKLTATGETTVTVDG